MHHQAWALDLSIRDWPKGISAFFGLDERNRMYVWREEVALFDGVPPGWVAQDKVSFGGVG